MENVFEIDEDHDVLIDFSEEFRIRSEEIDSAIIDLIDEPEVEDHFNQLLGLLNTVSGKASSCNIAPIVEPLKTLEMLIDHLRIRKTHLTELFRTLVEKLLGLLQYIADEAAEKGEVSFSLFIEIQTALQPVANLELDFTEAITRSLAIIDGKSQSDQDDAIDLFGDEVDLFDEPTEPTELAESVKKPPEPVQTSATVKTAEKLPVQINQTEIIQRDLSFFRLVGGLLNSRQKTAVSYTEVVLPIALGMNALGLQSVDFFQLEAAVYLHDIALIRLSDEDLQNACVEIVGTSIVDRQHPLLAYEMLHHMTYWNEAAKISLQHQERLDGSGYPEGLQGDQICDGAKILAICDTYYALAHKLTGKKSKNSMIQAITEINGNAGQLYDPIWVDRFKKAVRIQNVVGAT